MLADRLLGTLLRSLQTYTERQDTPRLLGTASSLLTTLNNPLNVSLLTSQLLSAPALWTRPDGLRACLGFMSVFHSAATRIKNREIDRSEATGLLRGPQSQPEDFIDCDEWVRSVIKGADERSSRSNHLLVFSGLLIGFGSVDDSFLPYSLNSSLQDAIVKAANIVTEDPTSDELSHLCIALALNHTFPYLSDFERSRIDCDRLLPILMHAMLHSSDGLKSGYFLGALDADVQQVSSQQFNWPASSGSFHQIQRMSTSPLISSLGPFSRLIAHTIEHLRESWLVDSLVDDLAEFAERVQSQWRTNKLSEIDPAEEADFLHQEARSTTLPVLWKLLRTSLFSIVIVLRSSIGRVLGDGSLAQDADAPRIAQQSLRILHNLNFVFSRIGSTAFSQYTFTYLTSIDILANYPIAAESFLRSVAPKTIGQIPAHPLDRVQDLFFLNAAEHFTAIVAPQTNEDLLIAAASPYLAAGGNRHLLPIFEAAHSVMLAVFSAPSNVEVTTRHLPFYVDALFKVFPHSLSSRQFRLAWKNLVRIASPPSMIAHTQPLLAATLLELLHERALHAATAPLLEADPANTIGQAQPPQQTSPPQSEQSVLVLTLIDSLSSLSLDLLEEWLPLCAALVNTIEEQQMREHCRQHMWETMVRGDMDAERSQICVAWWTTLGGREALLLDRPHERKSEFMMSGALPEGLAKL